MPRGDGQRGVPELSAPELAERAREVAGRSRLDYAHTVVDRLGCWNAGLPSSYDWVFDNETTLAARTEGRSPAGAMLEVLKAHARDIAAYSHMQLWKTHELVHGAVVLLNAGRYAAAAAPARSAVESAISLTTMVVRWKETADAFEAGRVEAPERLSRFSELLEALIWGGKSERARVPGRNVMTLKDALLKRVECAETSAVLDDVYAALCDIVHPSAIGHQVWWGRGVQPDDDTATLIPLAFGRPGPIADGVAEVVLWAVGWSSSWTTRSFRNGITFAQHLEAQDHR